MREITNIKRQLTCEHGVKPKGKCLICYRNYHREYARRRKKEMEQRRRSKS